MKPSNTYVYLLEKAIERIDSLDWRVLMAVSRGSRAIDLVSTGNIKLNLEKNEYSNSGSISLHENKDGKEHWLTSYLPSQRSHSCQDRFIEYMKKLVVLSRVAERLGYEQPHFDQIHREFEEGKKIYFEMDNHLCLNASISFQTVNHTTQYNSEEELIREIVEFEKEYSTPESISTMNPILKDLVVEMEIV